MRFLALIPARGGSKRLPGKNVRLLGDRPLIQWSVDLALRISPAVDVLVSTDNPEIASVARSAGASVPGLRPAELSSDTASTLDVALYELDRFESAGHPVDGLILLQPTSPFRRFSTVGGGLDLFRSSRGVAVVGVAPAVTHPAWCFRIDDGRMVPYHDGGGLSVRSQDLPPAFRISGGLYIVSPRQLRAGRTFFPPDAIPVVAETEVEALDIDTEWDWLCAEQALRAGLVDGLQE